MHGAKCWTDHRLVRSILNLHIAPTGCMCPKVIRSPFNMATLRHPTTTIRFRKHLIRCSRAGYPMLKTALWSGASLRRSSLKQQKLSWVLRNMNIRIGLMRLTSVSISYYMWRTRSMWSDKMTQAANPRQKKSEISVDKPRRDCMRWKTFGGTERQVQCKSMQTQTTQTQTIILQSSSEDCIQAHTIWTHPFTISWWINIG